MANNTNAQALLLALVFVGVAILFGGIAYVGFVNLNFVVAFIGCLALVAWFWAGRHILG